MKRSFDKLLERIALQQDKIVTIVMVFAIAYPFIITNQYLIRLSILALMYVMLSLGLNLVTGYMGQMSFGNAAFWGIGAYVTAIMTKNMSFGSGLAFLGAIIVTGIFGFLLGLPVLKLKGYYLTIVTMGFCEIMRLVELNWMQVTNGPLGIPGIPKFSIFGMKLVSYKSYYFIILILVVITTLIVRRIVNSRIGLAIKSIRDDDVATESMGVNIVKYKIMTFTISSMIAGAAGAFYAQYISYIDPSSFTYNASQEMLVIIIFGGLGSIPGCFLGAIILTVLPELLRGLTEYRMLIYGALMVIMMIVKPSGVLGNINFDHLKLIASSKKEEKGDV